MARSDSCRRPGRETDRDFPSSLVLGARRHRRFPVGSPSKQMMRPGYRTGWPSSDRRCYGRRMRRGTNVEPSWTNLLVESERDHTSPPLWTGSQYLGMSNRLALGCDLSCGGGLFGSRGHSSWTCHELYCSFGFRNVVGHKHCRPRYGHPSP